MQRDRASRTHVGETDCLRCLARGFRMIPDDEPEAGSFEWCEICGHSGRVALVESSRGFFAISPATLDAFLRAECLRAELRRGVAQQLHGQVGMAVGEAAVSGVGQGPDAPRPAHALGLVVEADQPYTWIRIQPYLRFVKKDVGNFRPYRRSLEPREWYRSTGPTETIKPE